MTSPVKALPRSQQLFCCQVALVGHPFRRFDGLHRGEAGRLQRLQEGRVAGERLVVIERAADLGDRAVTQIEQMLGRQLAAVILVDADRRGGRAARVADLDHGQQGRVGGEILEQLAFDRGGDDGAIDQAAVQVGEQAAFFLRVIAWGYR